MRKQEWKYIFLSLRPEHWVKNLLIFLPLIFGKKLFVAAVTLKVLAGFVIFSIITGVGYLMNDLMDIEKDKIHPLKCLRPIACGKVSVKNALFVYFILGTVFLALSFLLNIHFGFVVLAYLVFNLIYTKILKEFVILDVFCISGLFLLRILAGSVLAQVRLSHWIIIMTAFLALFLGFNKRRQEIQIFEKEAALYRNVLHNYNIQFIDQMTAVITSSIVVTYMFYTFDTRTIREFGTNHLAYGIPFVYYGIFRYLYIIHKQNKDGDPTNILFSDGSLQLNLILWVSICIAVIYFGI